MNSQYYEKLFNQNPKYQQKFLLFLLAMRQYYIRAQHPGSSKRATEVVEAIELLIEEFSTTQPEWIDEKSVVFKNVRKILTKRLTRS